VGTFRTDVTFANLVNRTRSVVVPQMLVDTGSEATWVPSSALENIGVERTTKVRTFVMANGQQVQRVVGYAFLFVPPDFETVDEVVFAEPGDLLLLGARSLEGLNVRVDPQTKQLVAAGPLPAAGNVEIKTKPEPSHGS
jgi:predicted aspartyl protease